MALIIQRPEQLPTTTEAALPWFLAKLQELAGYLKALVTLDRDTRALRSSQAESAIKFLSAVVTNAAVTQLAALDPTVITDVYTTALIEFDSTSGLGRWRMDGPAPIAAAGAASGMPIAAGGTNLNIVGQLNIRNFQVIAEGATSLQMSVHLFK